MQKGCPSEGPGIADFCSDLQPSKGEIAISVVDILLTLWQMLEEGYF